MGDDGGRDVHHEVTGEGGTAPADATPENDLPKGLGKPASRALASAGYARSEQFTAVSEAEVRGLHGMGPKALGELRKALAARGLGFRGP